MANKQILPTFFKTGQYFWIWKLLVCILNVQWCVTSNDFFFEFYALRLCVLTIASVKTLKNVFLPWCPSVACRPLSLPVILAPGANKYPIYSVLRLLVWLCSPAASSTVFNWNKISGHFHTVRFLLQCDCLPVFVNALPFLCMHSSVCECLPVFMNAFQFLWTSSSFCERLPAFVNAS